MSNEFILLTRTHDLLLWLVPRAEKFPRLYRHTVTRRLLDAALDFQEGLFLAQARRGRARTQTLQDCDAYLNVLRLYLRLAREWQWLSDGQYEHVSQMVAEIGRLLGGWIRQQSGTG